MSKSKSQEEQHWDAIWINANIATFSISTEDYGVMENAALAIKDGRIAWLGSVAEATQFKADETHDADGHWITPGLIDCHTHLVYAGNRAREFEMRLNGASYEELQKAGGGILSTVKATRAASEDELLEASVKRLESLKREGVTTVEIKSGYGLELETEIKMLKVARKIGDNDKQVDVVTTFLGAHALPPEYQNNSDAYIEHIVDDMLPAVHEEKLADAVDGFCEGIGFSPEQIERVFTKAGELELPVKLHAEQLSDLNGAALAARYKALSADHLEYISESGVKAMADAGSVAVLLPGAFYILREKQLPPVQLFREHAVPMAIATDANPGSSPITSLLTVLNMACTLFSLTPAEALAGVTRNAASALGLEDDRGTLEIGKRADFILWDIDHPSELVYMIGANPCVSVIKNGIKCR
ncbi:MAG: imidazolonepropionase [Gammaproteobacteria bacterium]|nr:imidazolonepropionase [Gammaproteobacteria bacterium]